MKTIDTGSGAIGVYFEAYKGSEYLHIRKQYTNKQGELRPTSKGITVTPAQAMQLLPLLMEVLEEHQTEKKIAEKDE